MSEWYTRHEVSNILGVSLSTVYHYAKQGKIIKIEDPHGNIRETRYAKEEVDRLAEERMRNKPTGLRPAELAKELGVPLQRIYKIIKDNNLPVDEIALGDAMTGYSIPDELAEWIKNEVKRVMPTRGTRAEFYNLQYDIALYQQFVTKEGQTQRVHRNSEQEWGFYLTGRTWITYIQGLNVYGFRPVYSLHQKNTPQIGYADFYLPKDREDSFYFLDFVYKAWGIENIRLRELDSKLELSIKSGQKKITTSTPERINQELINSFLVSGEVFVEEDSWNVISGTKRTTIELPIEMLKAVQNASVEEGITFSEYIEEAIKLKIEKD